MNNWQVTYTHIHYKFLFLRSLDMGERIAGKQDRPNLIIEDPLRAPKIAQK